jgi:aminopeptidase
MSLLVSSPRMPEPSRPTRGLAELAVRLGANLQPGQILSLASEPGKEQLARAVAEVAYERGAKFVDLTVFDYHLKRARAVHSDPELLDYVPPWYGERLLALGDHRCALVYLAGPAAPNVMDGVSPELLGKDMLPHVRESSKVVNDRTTNWTAVPCPTPGWAELVYPDLEPAAALARLWQEIGSVCRLDLDDPIAAWVQRLDALEAVAEKLTALQLDSLRFEGPGTNLTVGLFASSRWKCARLSTIDGIVHAPNLPTEEVFTTPDPARVQGIVRSTKPLVISGAVITGLTVRFEAGRAVAIDADEGATILRTLTERDDGAACLGEVALVDNESRIGQLGTVFYDTLLDENAASHIALGHGLDFAVEDPEECERVNSSELHIDFMIGSDEVSVTGVKGDGDEVALLRGGTWQV